jgi:hypothetical protein
MQRAYNPQPQQMPQQPPMVQQPTPMQPQMPNAYEMPIQDIKFVNKAQAEAYIVFPNTKVMLIDTESGIAHIKTADNMGQSKTEYFRFEPINADGSPIKPQEPIPQVNFDEFIKKQDLENFGFVTVSQYNELAQKLEQIQKRLEGVRTNVGQQPKQPESRV